MADASTQQITTKPATWPIWVLLSIGVLFLLVVFGREPFRHYQADRKLNPLIAKAKDLGIPLVASDIYPDPAPGTSNAAPELEKAFALRKKLSKADSKALSDFGILRPASGIEKAVRGAEPVFRQVEQAVAIRACHFPHDANEGAAMLMRELADMKMLAKIFAARSRLRAKLGQQEAALQDLQTIRKLENCITTPGLTSMMIKGYCEKTMAGVASENVQHCAGDAAMLAKYRQLVQEAPKADFMSMLRGEAWQEIVASKTIEKLEQELYKGLSSSERVTNEVPPTWRSKKAMTQVLASWTRLFEDIKPVVHDRNKALAVLEGFDDRHRKECSDLEAFFQLADASYAGAYEVAMRYDDAWLSVESQLKKSTRAESK